VFQAFLFAFFNTNYFIPNKKSFTSNAAFNAERLIIVELVAPSLVAYLRQTGLGTQTYKTSNFIDFTPATSVSATTSGLGTSNRIRVIGEASRLQGDTVNRNVDVEISMDAASIATNLQSLGDTTGDYSYRYVPTCLPTKSSQFTIKTITNHIQVSIRICSAK